jgi:uncharacterized membrane protein YphA (DoxX/SURF4 family)
MVSSSVLKVFSSVLTALLVLVYMAAGSVKLTPALSPEAHAVMVTGSTEWGAALFLDALGIPPRVLLTAIGAAEVILAILLLTPLATFAAASLAFIMVGAIITHVRLDDAAGAGPAFFLLIVNVILIVTRGLYKRAKANEESTKQSKTN